MKQDLIKKGFNTKTGKQTAASIKEIEKLQAGIRSSDINDNYQQNIGISHDLYESYNMFVNNIVHMSGFSNNSSRKLPTIKKHPLASRTR